MLNEDKIIGIYCFVDGLLKSLNHKEPSNRKVSNSELITTAIVSALYFGGHQDNARAFMKVTGLVPTMLDKSRFCSMRRYFYGVKVQVLTTSCGIPVEFCFVPGCESDVQALKKLPMHVAPESCIYADAAYTDYQAEDDLMEAEGIRLMVQRKSNSKRKDEPHLVFLKQFMRKKIETSFSEIKALFLRKIHAVTFKGFLLKIMLFITATTLNKLTN